MEQIQQQDSLWTKHFIQIMIVAFMVSITMNMTMTTLPLYGQHIGGSRSLAGYITAIFTLSALLFRPVFGTLLDNKGRKKVLVIGIFVFFLSVLSYNFAYLVSVLLFFRFIQGAGFSGHSTAAGTIVADIVPVKRLAEGIGYFGVANTLGSAIGPSIGLYIIKYFDYNILFIISAIFSLTALLIAYAINYEKEKQFVGQIFNKTKIKKEEIHKNQFEIKNEVRAGRERKVGIKVGLDNGIVAGIVIFEKSALPTSLVLFFVALTVGSIMTFIPIYALNKGIEDIGIFFIIYAFALLLTRIKMGKLVDRYGVTAVIIPGLMIGFIALIILAFAESLISFLIVAFLYGFSFATVYPTLNATMVRLCPPLRRGAGNATFFSAMDIGVGLGSVIWGYISELFGFVYVYLGAAVCIIFALFFYFLMEK